MAMTVGVARELGAPAPAVPRNLYQPPVVLLLSTLTASVTLSAERSPSGGVRSDEAAAHIRGHALLFYTTDPQRYRVFLYCKLTAFVAWLAVTILLLENNPVNQPIKLLALRVAVTLGLLCLIAAYVAVSSLSFITSMCVIALAAAVVLYIATQIPLLLCKPVPQKRPKVLPWNKSKYLLKVEQTNRRQQNIMSGKGGGDASHQILTRSRMHMLLLSTLVASVTYQAGLNPMGGFWHGEDTTGIQYHYASSGMLHDKTRYLVFFCCNASAFVVSLAIVVAILLLTDVFSTRGIKYHCALEVAVAVDLFCLTGAYLAVTLGQFCLIGAYVAGSMWQLSRQVYISTPFVWVYAAAIAIHVVPSLLAVLLGWALWRRALKKMEHCVPGWLKKLFGLSTDGHAEEEEEEEELEEGEEEEEEDEGTVAMELNLERGELLLLLAILAAILAYHATTSPPPDNLVGHRLVAFECCKATVFIASISIIAMLGNKKQFPAARGVRWHAMRVCVILDVIGLTGTFAARGYWKISSIDVLFLVCSVLLCIAFHVASSISGMPRGRDLVQSLLTMLGLCHRDPAMDLAGPTPLLQDDDTQQHDFDMGIIGGTNEEPLGVEIVSRVLGGAFTLIVAVPVVSIVAIPLKLLVGIMIATIGLGLWRRSLPRLLVPLVTALQRRRRGTASPTAGSSIPPEQGLCKLIHVMCSETWMWIIILVFWVPSLRKNLRLKFKISRILAVLSVLVDGTPTPNTTTGTAASTTTTATIDTPSTATSTVVGTSIITAAASGSGGTSITAAASGTTMGCEIRPLVEPRPRRNRRPNTQVSGPDWVN